MTSQLFPKIPTFWKLDYNFKTRTLMASKLEWLLISTIHSNSKILVQISRCQTASCANLAQKDPNEYEVL